MSTRALSDTTNVLVEISKRENRDYIMPEDISEALQTHAAIDVRMDFLEVLAEQTGIGVEDYSACAYAAWIGE